MPTDCNMIRTRAADGAVIRWRCACLHVLLPLLRRLLRPRELHGGGHGCPRSRQPGTIRCCGRLVAGGGWGGRVYGPGFVYARGAWAGVHAPTSLQKDQKMIEAWLRSRAARSAMLPWSPMANTLLHGSRQSTRSQQRMGRRRNRNNCSLRALPNPAACVLGCVPACLPACLWSRAVGRSSACKPCGAWAATPGE
jgi:hypothetical protein